MDADLACDDGCTATAVLAWRDDAGAVCLQAANVGDSAAVAALLPPGMHVPSATPVVSSPDRFGPRFLNPFAQGSEDGGSPRRGPHADLPPGLPPSPARRVPNSPTVSFDVPSETKQTAPLRGVATQHEEGPTGDGPAAPRLQAVTQLTADHRLTSPGERERLAGLGVQLSDGRTRLYGLNLARCLGDKFLKVWECCQWHAAPVQPRKARSMLRCDEHTLP